MSLKARFVQAISTFCLRFTEIHVKSAESDQNRWGSPRAEIEGFGHATGMAAVAKSIDFIDFQRRPKSVVFRGFRRLGIVVRAWVL